MRKVRLCEPLGFLMCQRPLDVIDRGQSETRCKSYFPMRVVGEAVNNRRRWEMRVGLGAGLATVLTACCLATVMGPAVAQSSPVARGGSIAHKHCARCHAVEATGQSPMGLAPPFRELSKRYPIEYLAEALAEGIVTGHPAMPRFTFEPRDIDALLTYIAGLTRSGPAPRP
jgi:cytochrome c